MELLKLENLVGKALNDEDVLRLFSFIKKDPSKVKVKKGDIDAVVENEKMGVQITFVDFESIEMGLEDPDVKISDELLNKLNYMKSFPEGMLFLTDLDLDQSSDNRIIDELLPLPAGISFGMDKESIYRLLGKPTLDENEEFNTAGWIFGYYKYAVRFTDDDIFFSFGINFMEHSHLMEF